MIYVENDFYSNFSSVAKSNDDVAMRGVLVDQISSVIANRKDELIDLFGKTGIKVSKKPTNKELSNLVVSNLKGNKKFVIGVAYLIAKENDILQGEMKKDRPTDVYSGQDGEKTKEKKPVDWNKSADAVTTIAGSISVFADTLTGIKQGSMASDINQQTNSKSNGDSEAEQKAKDELELKKKKRRKVIIGVVVLAVVAGGLFYAYKKGYIFKKSTVQ